MKKLNAVVASVLVAATVGAAQAENFMPWTDIMKLADSNKDQIVSPAEVMMFKFADQYPGFQPFIATHFMNFDADKDGMITFDEFHAQMGSLKMDDDAMNRAFSIGSGFMPWDQQS
jgi:Ca2+-binding EF-hand superfamily protein